MTKRRWPTQKTAAVARCRAYLTDLDQLRRLGGAHMRPIDFQSTTMKELRKELARIALQNPGERVSLYQGEMCLDVWNEEVLV